MVDLTDSKIIEILSTNSRLSFADLGRQINLSPSAVRERILRLEDIGIIKKYNLKLDKLKLGYQIEAFILIKIFTGKLKTFLSIVHEIEEVQECYRITGNQNVQLKVHLKNQMHLQKLLDNLINNGDTSTFLILFE